MNAGQVFSVVCILFIFMIGLALALVESGFSASKNAGNAIIKQLIVFSVSIVLFLAVGYSLYNCTNGVIGMPDASLIAGGGTLSLELIALMAECMLPVMFISGGSSGRTQIKLLLLDTVLISAIVFPLAAGWTWFQDGWLHQLGYIDFGGAGCICTVGGIGSLFAIKAVGARANKYYTDDKKRVRSNALPAHNVPLAAVGTLLAWVGWFGLTGYRMADLSQVEGTFFVMLLSTACSVITCLIFTWWKTGSPEITTTLSAALGGTIAASAGGYYLSTIGAIITGILAGLLVSWGVDKLDSKYHIDDPIGSVAVGGMCGILGLISEGVFDQEIGLISAGSFVLLGVELLGVLVMAALAIVCIGIPTYLMKKTGNVRVSKEDEILGMDMAQNGMESAYADFMEIAPRHNVEEEFDVDMDDIKPVELSSRETRSDGRKYTKVTVICAENKFGALKDAMEVIGVTGMTVSNVVGCGVQKGKTGTYRGVRMSMNLLPKIKVDIVVSTVDPGLVVAVAQRAIYTGNVGDGKIFVSEIDDVMKVRTGGMGVAALSDDD